MRISLDWIKEFTEVTAPPQEIAHRLTMAGLEIEGMESVDGDTVMEVNVTPNRPDCLSMLGIAREVAALYELPLRMPETLIKGELKPSEILVTIDDPDLCPRYAGRTIDGMRVAQSPDWMKTRLEKCGIRAINNIVDITNYVLLEFGQPLHAFDSAKLSGRKIRVARAGSNADIKTLDGVDRALPGDALVIWNGDCPVAVAGIMGGGGSSVGDSTESIFLESACFQPASIRKSSKTLGLRSESSYRFERGTDRVMLEAALNRASLLMAELGGGTIREIVDVYPVKYSPPEIFVSYAKINSLLGVEVEEKETLRLLDRIGIDTEKAEGGFVARPPAFRGDISCQVDIIEEVARCYGYDRIPARTPRAALSDGIPNRRELFIRTVRESVRRNGFSEVVNFSFMNGADLDLLSIGDGEGERRRRHVMLKNPLRQEECLMRTTLLPSLIRNFIHNLSRGVRNIRLFEISRVFIHCGEQLPSEGMRICGIFFQDASAEIWKDSVPPFFSVKGALEALFAEIRLSGCDYVPSREVFLHPGRSADIICSGNSIGYVGELAPHVAERLDLKVNNPQIVVFDLDLDRIMSGVDDKITYRKIPVYPSIERDVALIVDDELSAADVLKVFREFNSELIESVDLFDYYKGRNIPEGKKSLGLRVTYRDRSGTLSDADIEPVQKALVGHVSQRTGAMIRGIS